MTRDDEYTAWRLAVSVQLRSERQSLRGSRVVKRRQWKLSRFGSEIVETEMSGPSLPAHFQMIIGDDKLGGNIARRSRSKGVGRNNQYTESQVGRYPAWNSF